MNESPDLFLDEPERYLRERVDEQLAWYENKSAISKRWYYRLQIVTLISAATIPVITLSSGEFVVRLVVALLGSVTAVSAGLLSLYQFRDQWIDYRATAEVLKFERYRFVTRVDPYVGSDAFSQFVNRIEAVIIQENQGWQQKQFGLEREADDGSLVDVTEAPADPDDPLTSVRPAETLSRERAAASSPSPVPDA